MKCRGDISVVWLEPCRADDKTSLHFLSWVDEESEEEKSVGKKKEKAKTRREAWEREARKANKVGENEKKRKKNSFFIHKKLCA